MNCLCYFAFTITLITSVAVAAPIYNKDAIVHPRLTDGDNDEGVVEPNPNFDSENEESLARDIENLRKLDAIIGRAENAVMSNEEINFDDDLPEIERKLERIDHVELVNPEDALLDVAEDLRETSKKEFSVIDLPYNFEKYDSNGDGFITPSELAHLTETKLRDSLTPFERADSNGDGLLTVDEFHRAPWKFDINRSMIGED